MNIKENIHKFQQDFERLSQNIAKVIKGKNDVIQNILTSMVANGHIMLLDYPGTGKTVLVKAISASLQCDFKRIQFTPDVLPMDITGSMIFNMQSRDFEFQKGPVFCNLLLADEINRASPKTQSALLEVMAERQVTVAGKTYKLPPPFLVIATMNPLDAMQGTYQLPAAQLDRFSMQLSMGFPDSEAEMEILDVHLSPNPILESLEPVISIETFLSWQKLVPFILLSSDLKTYLINFMNHLRSDSSCLTPPSPRTTLMLARVSQAKAMIEGRDYVTPMDIQKMAPLVLSHRLRITGSQNAKVYVENALSKIEVPE